MAATTRVSEEELADLLRSDPPFAFKVLHLDFGSEIMGHAKRASGGVLNVEDLRDVLQETLLAFARRLRKPGFDPNRPLGMLKKIAHDRAVDRVRARIRRPASTNEDEFIATVADCLGETEIGSEWRLLSAAERHEFSLIVAQVIQTLPARQQLVATCYCHCFEEVAKKGFIVLKNAVSAITKREESVATVKSNWHAAKEKIAAALRRRYPFIHRSKCMRGSKQEREECALDALIVSALRQNDSCMEIDPKRLPELTAEEQAALSSLDQFVEQVWDLAGSDSLPPEESADCEIEVACADAGASFALNRAEEVDQQTADEIERRKREILNRIRNKPR